MLSNGGEGAGDAKYVTEILVEGGKNNKVKGGGQNLVDGYV